MPRVICEPNKPAQIDEGSNKFPHSANKKSKLNSHHRQNNNCQDAYHRVVVPDQSYNLEDADYEQPGQFPKHYCTIEISFSTSWQGEKLVTVPYQVNQQENRVAEENDFIVRQVARVIYVYRDNGGVEG